MTNFRGIALITETIRHLLSQAATMAVPNANVRIGPPEGVKPGGEPTVNVFLYTVRPTATILNADVPTRDADGAPMTDPTVSLELDYVISFTGADNTPQSELLLGAAVATFHTSPFITEEFARDALRGLSQSNLDTGDVTYPIAIMPLSLSTDERSKLWSMFFQVPYRLSVEYRVRAMLLPAGLDVAAPPIVPEVATDASHIPRAGFDG